MDEYAHVYDGDAAAPKTSAKPRGNGRGAAFPRPPMPAWLPDPPAFVKRLQNRVVKEVVTPGLAVLRFALMQAEERIGEAEVKAREFLWSEPEE